uniref:Homeobox domain-containing protein n=1 Tax=Calidris pygmaea TaxID=425635 RepID=A0A8C3JTA1_9CHAR
QNLYPPRVIKVFKFPKLPPLSDGSCNSHITRSTPSPSVPGFHGPQMQLCSCRGRGEGSCGSGLGAHTRNSLRYNGLTGQGKAETPPPRPGEEASPSPLPSYFAAPDGGWPSADESSGYESAGGEGPVAAGGSLGRQRRARTAFTSEQVCRLEKTFQRQKYLGASERRKLGAALQLSEMQIKTWFQNRRMKLKRQIQDPQHRFVSPAPLYTYPPGTLPALFQDGLHYAFAPQHQRLLSFTLLFFLNIDVLLSSLKR